MSNQSDLIAQDINEYLKQHEHKELLRLLTCGSVDDGKSTLIGRLLHDSKMIYEDQLESIKADSVKSGTTGEEIDLALLVDGLQAEREQGITIDVAYRFFSTTKRKFIIADTPGHEQYTRNMATGASTANMAIILIDARHGVLTQTRRHSFIASLLGIKHIVVAINKMDIVDFSEDRYNEIKAQYLELSSQLNIDNIYFAPISALKGDNVVDRSENMPWFEGQTLMELLESVEISADRNLENFRFPVQYVNRPNLDFRGFCGTVASGKIHPGDEIMALPSRQVSTVKDIVTFDGNLDEAFADQAVTLTLKDEIDISRGDMIVKADDMPEVGASFDAHVVWMAEDALKPGKLYDIKLGTSAVSGSVQKIHHLINVNTFEKDQGEQLDLNSIALCRFHLNQPVAFDAYKANRTTGAFIIIDRLTNVTIGAGMIENACDEGDLDEWAPVTAEERAIRFNQQPLQIACTGAAAEQLALDVERKLFDMGKSAVVLSEVNTADDQERNKVAQILVQSGLIAVTVLESATEQADIVLTAESDSDLTKDIKSLLKQLK
ncbi:sulfate adenylyltransferase subunit CysN [Alkalimarinus alittae]|uniref:Sulfate adenylyltransferase subunit 1 n=1 Tax=Alkalimarinus alittae TaxID=2961619 RepID=A0ABY6N4S2_9ALTE|nr:sulfate adenylyltransferase subunit CysN [Alkalimarinus alittae]UZE97118.1 sulfate adenylyltransferase subunit CysN [Alkalimarinus alittae]